MLFQSSTIPKTTGNLYPNLDHSLLSNRSTEVSILLHIYFTKININTTVICGLFRGPRGNAFPQVFLDIGGHTIDNIYTHLEEKWTPERNMKVFVERFTERKQVENYVREAPSASKLPIIGKDFLGEKFVKDDIDYLEIVCATELNQKKHMAMHINKSANPGVRVYDILMRDHIGGMTGVVEEMQGLCWECGVQGGDQLKTCTGCKVARYCNKDCLMLDWGRTHKLMHKIWKNQKK